MTLWREAPAEDHCLSAHASERTGQTFALDVPSTRTRLFAALYTTTTAVPCLDCSNLGQPSVLWMRVTNDDDDVRMLCFGRALDFFPRRGEKIECCSGTVGLGGSLSSLPSDGTNTADRRVAYGVGVLLVWGECSSVSE